jgi:hypothetical protein
MDDRIGLGQGDSFPDRRTVEAIEHKRRGAHPAQLLHLPGTTSSGRDLVSRGHQLLQERPAHRSGRVCKEYAHGLFTVGRGECRVSRAGLIADSNRDEMPARAVTVGSLLVDLVGRNTGFRADYRAVAHVGEADMHEFGR